jgi:two-component system, OmpR family, sensor histidine kinase VicK
MPALAKGIGVRPRMNIKNRLFLAILVILVASFATLIITTIRSFEGFFAMEADREMEVQLNHARNQYLVRAEQFKYSLLTPASAGPVHDHLKARDTAWLKDALTRWKTIIPHAEILLIVDPRMEVIARAGSDFTGDRVEFGGTIARAFQDKKPVTSTEIVSNHLICREGEKQFCATQSPPPDQLNDAMALMVVVPIVDKTGSIIGGIVAGEVINKDPIFPEQMKRGFDTKTELSIYQRGTLVASSFPKGEAILRTMPSSVRARLETGQASSETIRLGGRDFLVAFTPITNISNEVVGALSVALSLEDIKVIRRQNEKSILFSAMIGVFLSFTIALISSRKLTEPLKALSRGVERIEQGDFTQRVDVSSTDEFGTLAATFNRMMDALAERDRTITKKTDDLVTLNTLLKELNDLLEKKVTERTDELRMEMGMLEAILTSMAEGVVVTGRENRITLFNPAAQRIFDLVPHRVLHQPIDQVCEHYGLMELSRFVRDAMSSGEAPTVREGEMTLNGKKLKVSLSPLLDAEGSANGVVMSIRDVTVEQEVDRMKNEFISTVSHELKTPLTSMKGSLQFIMNKAKWLTGTEREMLAVCLRNTERLIRLIGDILDISKIESGGVTMHCKPLSVGELALYAIEEIKSFAASRNITIVNGIEGQLPPIYGDHDRLMQVLTNLLSNAVKFSPEGKVVMVTAERQENYMAISVSDSGKEIQWSDREKLFKKFQQLDSTDSASRGGTGLGLAICKEIVERHHGKIYYTSGLSGGNIFTFSVPIYEEIS